MKNLTAALSLLLFVSAPTLARAAVTAPDVPPIFGIDAGLGVIDSKFNFGAGLRAELPVNFNSTALKVGGQTGFYVGPSDPTTWTLPVLATASYAFKSYQEMLPYIGFGLGFSIAHVSVGSASKSSTDFAFLFKPGCNFSKGNYYFEVPIGTLANAFVFLPSIGAHF